MSIYRGLLGASLGKGNPAAVKVQLWGIPSVRNPATSGGADPGGAAVPGAPREGAGPGGKASLEPIE
jgi:hypothetical protein